jgi:hypothetical protein
MLFFVNKPMIAAKNAPKDVPMRLKPDWLRVGLPDLRVELVFVWKPFVHRSMMRFRKIRKPRTQFPK